MRSSKSLLEEFDFEQHRTGDRKPVLDARRDGLPVAFFDPDFEKRMEARQLGDPVAVIVLVEPDDRALQRAAE